MYNHVVVNLVWTRGRVCVEVPQSEVQFIQGEIVVQVWDANVVVNWRGWRSHPGRANPGLIHLFFSVLICCQIRLMFAFLLSLEVAEISYFFVCDKSFC